MRGEEIDDDRCAPMQRATDSDVDGSIDPSRDPAPAAAACKIHPAAAGKQNAAPPSSKSIDVIAESKERNGSHRVFIIRKRRPELDPSLSLSIALYSLVLFVYERLCVVKTFHC